MNSSASSSNLKIGCIVLAAGESGRLGQPKQLVMYRDKLLLQHVIDTAEKIDFKISIVVLGAYAKEIQKETNFKSFRVCINDEWHQGMASSLRLGIEKIESDLDGVLILVGDQPFVSQEILMELIHSFEFPGDIIACQYNGINGVPVLLGKDYFEELLALEGDTGARNIIKKHHQKVKSVKFDQGNFDIDTPEDLKRLMLKDQQWE